MSNIEYLPGVYKIRNLVNNKVYIGSTKNLKHRYWNHFSCLNRNKHGNHYLQYSFNKYGKDNFVFEVICYCENDIDYLIYLEKELIRIYDSTNYLYGYNHRKEPQINSGIVFSDESKEKMSIIKKGKSKPNYIGSGNPMAKLSDDDVHNIKILLAETNIPLFKIANMFNVNSTTIGTINNGKQWEHIIYSGSGILPRISREKENNNKKVNEVISKRQLGTNNSFYGKKHSSETKKLISESSKGENNFNSKLAYSDVLEIRKMLNNDISASKIAKKYNVHMNTIYCIKNGNSWNNIN